jgi:uncharacterized protein (DUF488 family)
MLTTVYTIGHSTLTIDEFIAILKAHTIELVADVRTIAKSRHNPQFGENELQHSLKATGIDYVRLEKLGGLRKPVKNSINTAWRNKSFQGYADYMQTLDFWQGIDVLIAIASQKTTVVMCAEAVPWRCHRSLLGDALLAKNMLVKDIMNSKTLKPHSLTPFAKIDDGRILYSET